MRQSGAGRGVLDRSRRQRPGVAESRAHRDPGFPPPELQRRFRLSDGADAYVDFFWREHRHIGEFDGVGKYRDPALLRGLTPEQALIAEKDREDDLRRQVSAFSRWRTPALARPQRLYDILRSAGLPTARPRPGR